MEQSSPSLNSTQEGLISLVEELTKALEEYTSELDTAEEQAISQLGNMTDEITFDLKTYDLFEDNIDRFRDDQVEEGCKKIDVADKYLTGSNGFNETIEKCKTSFTNAVSPNLLQIFKEIDELNKYNGDNSDMKAVENRIRNLNTSIPPEIEAVKNNVAGALKEFKSCIAEPASKCNTFFEGFFGEFKQLLNITASASN